MAPGALWKCDEDYSQQLLSTTYIKSETPNARTQFPDVSGHASYFQLSGLYANEIVHSAI